MKKTLLTFLSITLSILIVAQIKQKSILLGGQLGYSNQQSKYDIYAPNLKTGNINISAGKAFKENLIIGINLGYLFSRYTQVSPSPDVLINKNKYFNGGLFLRQYKKLAKDFYLFGEGNLSFLTSKQKNYNNNTNHLVRTNGNGGFLSVSGGVAYQLLKKLQLEITIPDILYLDYRSSSEKQDIPVASLSKITTFNFHTYFSNATNLQSLNLGFHFIL